MQKLFLISCWIVFISLSSSAATTENLSPISLKSNLGKNSDQSISVLAKKDQSGTADTWAHYIELYPEKSGYTGDFSFKTRLKSLSSLAFSANFKGLSEKNQEWQFTIYNYKTQQWVALANNKSVKSWRWSLIQASLPKVSADYISPSQDVLVRLTTSSAKDNCNLDLIQLILQGNDEPTSPVPLPTPAPTPTPSPSPAPVPSGSWWKPAPGTSWDIQYSGNINYNLPVQAMNIDLFDTPQDKINAMKARGVKVICYFSAGSYEEWRPDEKKFPPQVVGKNLDGWPGENWLDASNLVVLMPIMTARMDLAVQKKCDALDLDNMDIYLQDSGFKISYAQNLAYSKALVKEAHKRNLAIGLKNNLEQIKDLVDDYDFAVNEQCHQYKECDYLKPFVQQGKAVFGIEYNQAASKFCPQANANNFDFLRKNLSLNQARETCR